MQRILVTGATGFIGRRVCAKLIARGHDVVAVLRKTSRRDVLPPNIEYYVVDGIGPETAWNQGLLRSIDTVVHLAAHVHQEPSQSVTDAAEFYAVNAAGTLRLVEAVADRVGRFVYVSSVHAMCSLADDVLTEYSECQPDSDYGKSKLAAEKAVRKIGEASKTETVILRPPPVYGPGQVGNLNRLFDAVQSGKFLPFGLFTNRRSLIYVENLVDAVIACVEHAAAAGETFLVSDGEDVSVKDLIRRIGAATENRRWVLPVPTGLVRLGGLLTGRSRDVRRLLGSLAVDIAKIRGRLGWQPPFSLDEGLRQTVASMTAERAA